ncbi:uncharacterized protein N7498_006789 [Penicillium cinerascens]|uniref:Uncharacterized protein n=1 Tax=Penicillium cinerascens TaxID=70096 RepID=A0A9W9MIS6_9EURO|nr:uncharacterized protein N7498_006789 [Penicillium cinerascens]KAJ5202126.1 hypothetical protein N7498_006789 [Penicillium cinerascens]
MQDKIARTDLGLTTEYDSIVSRLLVAHYAAAMIHRTGILGQFLHVEPEQDPNDDHERAGPTAIE